MCFRKWDGDRRHFKSGEQKVLVRKSLEVGAAEFEEIKRKAKEEANRKRSEAMQGVPYAPKGVERKSEKVGEQSVPAHSHPERQAKAEALKVNRGAVQRAEYIAKNAPELADDRTEAALISGDGSLADCENHL